MSELAHPKRALRWRSGPATEGSRGFVLWAAVPALLSLVLSEITVTARTELWLGPQTLILGGIGACVGGAVMLLGWRFARAGDGDVFDRPLLAPRGVLVSIIACAVLAASILCLAFARFPNSADEYGFLFQADTFRHLHLWNAPPADPGLFEQNLIIARDGIWISQYLPGWPAIIALFELARLPPWLAAPVCGAMLLLLLWAALRLVCRSTALTVALLLTYASSGFFLLNSATYFSHCAGALTVTGTILCMLQAQRSGSWGWPMAGGVCVGLALLCRIDSAALAGVAALGAWIEQGRSRRALLLGIAGAAPLVAVSLTYNWLVTGSPIMPPTAWAGQIQFGAGGLQGIEAAPGHFRMLVQTFWRLGELADTASLVVPVLYLIALAMRIRSRRCHFYDLVPIANVVIFLIYPDLGGFQMGPRYWFDGFVVMHLTLGSVYSQQQPEWQRFVVACCLLLVPVSLARLPGQVAFEARVVHERSSMFRLGDSLPADRRSVILVNDFPSVWNERASRTAPNFGKDFVRNGIHLDAPVLYARGDAPAALERACRLYPGATAYAFHLDHARPQGWLEPLPCVGDAH